MSLVDQLGDEVVGKEGKVKVKSLEDNDLVGLYFSAHWCPPCRGFTPALAETYKKIKAAGKKFEIVFISSDRDQASCDGYYADMPWLILDFNDRERKDQLSAKYGIQGIPTLVLLKGSGEVVTKEGRAKVMGDLEGESFPWS